MKKMVLSRYINYWIRANIDRIRNLPELELISFADCGLNHSSLSDEFYKSYDNFILRPYLLYKDKHYLYYSASISVKDFWEYILNTDPHTLKIYIDSGDYDKKLIEIENDLQRINFNKSIFTLRNKSEIEKNLDNTGIVIHKLKSIKEDLIASDYDSVKYILKDVDWKEPL